MGRDDDEEEEGAGGGGYDAGAKGSSPFGCVETPLHAIGAVLAQAKGGAGHKLTFEPGCADLNCARDPALLQAASAAAGGDGVDQVVVLLGISQDFEGEGHDRTNTSLPGAQEELLVSVARAAAAKGKPVAVVFMNGGIVSVDSLPSLPVAVVEAWYPGIRGSAALADALFGRSNRWGKLPVTVYRSSFSKQVKMTEMSFTRGLGRSYKYWAGDAPLFPFGLGLSYTTFSLVWQGAPGPEPPPPPPPATIHGIDDTLKLDVRVANTGNLDGDEVIFVYHVPKTLPSASAPVPLPKRKLVDFRRVAVARGASVAVSFTVPAASLGLASDATGDIMLFPGKHELVVDRGHGPVLTLAVDVVADAPVMIESLF